MASFLHPDNILDLVQALQSNSVTEEYLVKSIKRLSKKDFSLQQINELVKQLSAKVSNTIETLEDKQEAITRANLQASKQYVQYIDIKRLCDRHKLKCPAKETLNSAKIEKDPTKKHNHFLVESLLGYFNIKYPQLIKIFNTI